ncbi:hypothetical protein TNCT6_08030 [Streptomyces sp. 6-11-2]|nr:hypothetical protein TNCT6_08030 [Streptomyces sp. 6-11-2]
MRGSWWVRPWATRRNSSSIGSMSGEWKAWLTRSRVVLRSCASKWTAIAATSSSSPATTTDDGPLTAAIETLSVRCGTTSSSVARTASIAPPRGSACIRRARAATSWQASSSDSTPATWTAAISPMEWPPT